MLFVHNALINSFNKSQNTVKSSTFVLELVALKIARDMIVEIIIKLKIFVVPFVGQENIFLDKNGVVKNTSIPESTNSKKHDAINYHFVRKANAYGIMHVKKEDRETNLADPLTRLIPYLRKQELLGCLIYDY